MREERENFANIMFTLLLPSWSIRFKRHSSVSRHVVRERGTSDNNDISATHNNFVMFNDFYGSNVCVIRMKK